MAFNWTDECNTLKGQPQQQKHLLKSVRARCKIFRNSSFALTGFANFSPGNWTKELGSYIIALEVSLLQKGRKCCRHHNLCNRGNHYHRNQSTLLPPVPLVSQMNPLHALSICVRSIVTFCHLYLGLQSVLLHSVYSD